jgi:pyrroline-5-carboxylate reductase
MKKIGMIGVGNMGGAILRGMIASGYVAKLLVLYANLKRRGN